MMLKSESVSTSRPGDVPTADPMYVMRNPLARISTLQDQMKYMMRDTYPSGLARISSVMEESKARLLFLNFGRYGLETSK